MTTSMKIYVSGTNRWIKEETSLVLRQIVKENDTVWDNIRQSKYKYNTLGRFNKWKKEIVLLDELLIHQTLVGLKTGAISFRVDSGDFDVDVVDEFYEPEQEEELYIRRQFSGCDDIPKCIDYDVLAGDAHIFNEEYVNFDFTFIPTTHIFINPFIGLSLYVLVKMPIQKAFGLYNICKQVFDYKEIVFHLKRCLMTKFSKDIGVCLPNENFENTLVDECLKSYYIKQYDFQKEQVYFWLNSNKNKNDLNINQWQTLIVNDYGNGRIEKQYL